MQRLLIPGCSFIWLFSGGCKTLAFSHRLITICFPADIELEALPILAHKIFDVVAVAAELAVAVVAVAAIAVELVVTLVVLVLVLFALV